MDMEIAKIIVIKEDKVIEAFDRKVLMDSIEEIFGISMRSYSPSLISMLTDEVVKKLELVGTELYTEDIYHAVMDAMDENGYDEESMIYRLKYRKEEV
jgi:transcriptional regulator NrdR family protein